VEVYTAKEFFLDFLKSNHPVSLIFETAQLFVFSDLQFANFYVTLKPASGCPEAGS
jgi:hypothetical protein